MKKESGSDLWREWSAVIQRSSVSLSGSFFLFFFLSPSLLSSPFFPSYSPQSNANHITKLCANAQAILLLVDLTRIQSLRILDIHIPTCLRLNPSAFFVLVGTKWDEVLEREKEEAAIRVMKGFFFFSFLFFFRPLFFFVFGIFLNLFLSYPQWLPRELGSIM